MSPRSAVGGEGEGHRVGAVTASSVFAVVAVMLLSAVLVGCGFGADSSESTRAGSDTTAPVLRYVAAPRAANPAPVPDPRCRAARRLFLRAAVAPAPRPFVVDEETERLLDQVEVLATAEVRADLDETRAFVDRFLESPGQLTPADLAASVDRMDRLLIWAVSVCPAPQRPVWGCSTQIEHPFGSPFQPLYFGAVGQAAPDVALQETLGAVSGERVELTRSANRVVYGWLDGFGLVRRRAEVKRVLDLWFVVDAKRCDDPVSRPHPLDSGEVIVEELPDIADGPEYAPTTTEPTTTLVEESLPGVTNSPTVPYTPCRWDPNDTTDDYETLGDYMANGPAENGCWDLLTDEGRACLDDPPSGEFFACFDV